MDLEAHAAYKEHAFDSFCKKVLTNEARDFYDEMKRLQAREVTFSDLGTQISAQLSMLDDYYVQGGTEHDE